MPRIFDSGNSAHDFCRKCFPTEGVALTQYSDERITGVGPDDRGNCFGYDTEHPPFEYEEYDCYACGKRLTGKDN